MKNTPVTQHNEREEAVFDSEASRSGADAAAGGCLQAVLETCGDAIIGRDLDGTVFCWNPAAERLYGYPADTMIGRPVSALEPPERAQESEGLLREVLRGERVKDFETVRVTKEGRRIDVALTVTPVRGAGGGVVGVLTLARDRTEDRQAERARDQLAANHQNRALVLETASQVALNILASRTGIEALRHIAEAARTLAGARYAALGVKELDGSDLSEFITVGLAPEEEAVIGPRPKGRGVLGLLLTRTEPLRIGTLAEHPASVGFPANHPQMSSFLGVPIRHGDTVLGSLYLTDKEDGTPFTEADEAAVQALGAHAAVAIHNLQMLSRQRALMSGLINAQEEERRAVAYDLHDGLTQFVMASHAHLEAFRRAHEAGNAEKAAREMERGLGYLKEAVIESRRLVNGLRTLALDDLGLAGALEQLVAEEKARAGWQDADLVHNVAGRRFDRAIETAAYRVAQEALTNARKYARTQQVRVLLLAGTDARTGAPSLTLEVRDRGIGFVPDLKVDANRGFGLHGIVERVTLLGGVPEIRTAPGEGTTIRAVLPALEPQPERNNEEGNHQL